MRRAILLFAIVSLLLASCGTGTDQGQDAEPTGASQASESLDAEAGSQTRVPAHPGTIAFAQATGEGSDIYVIDTDGSGLTRLTRGKGTYIEHPAWSPDGAKIAYQWGGCFMLDCYAVWAMNADGSRMTQLTHDPLHGSFPAWSPDGRQIAFSNYSGDLASGFDIYVMDADGGDPRRVTRGAADDMFPAWSPEGTILFLRKDSGWSGHAGDVFAVSPDGTGLARVTSIGSASGFGLSPDGGTLAVFDVESRRIVALPADGDGSPTPLADVGFYPLTCPSWSPDGQALALAPCGLETSGSDLLIVNGDGSGLTTVPNASRAFDPAWRPD